MFEEAGAQKSNLEDKRQPGAGKRLRWFIYISGITVFVHSGQKHNLVVIVASMLLSQNNL